MIGKGSFGQVAKVYDHKLQQHLALKMVRNEKRFHRQAQEEIRILEHLRKQDRNGTMNVVHMLENFTFRNHICMTFELLSMNLYELIKRNKFQGFSLPLVRKFAHSILQCLEALNRHRIIHCDLKPENILLKQQGRSGIKVRRSPWRGCARLVCKVIAANVAHSTHTLRAHARSLCPLSNAHPNMRSPLFPAVSSR